MRNLTHRMDPAFAKKLDIPRLDDLPGMVAINSVLTPLEQRAACLDFEIERLQLEKLFRNSDPASDCLRDQPLRDRLNHLRALPPFVADPFGGADARSVAMQRAQDVLDGKPVPPDLDFDGQLQEARRQREILRQAICEQSGRRDEEKTERSREVAERLKSHHDAMTRRIFNAARELCKALEEERELRAALILAGFDQRPDILPPPFLPGASALGSESFFDSQISSFRRMLEKRGVL